MSDIKTAVLEVNTGGAITNIKDFKQHIEGLKGTLLGLEKGTEEYNTVAKELQASQQKLNEVMDVAKGKGEAVAGSYDNLQATMTKLRKEWKATGDEVERKKIGEKIIGINNQLKELDASTGNFQRNVGNYSSAFSDAFTKLGSSIISGAIPAVKGLNMGFKALIANPIGAVIAAIVVVIQALIKSIKGSEEQTNRMKVATAGLQVVMDGVKNVISKVSDVVVTLTENISKLIINGLNRLSGIFKKLGWEEWASGLENFTEKVTQYTEEEKKAVDISKKRRQINEEIARTENKISDLRAKIAEKNKYTEQERLQFIEDWENAEKKRAQLAISLAQEEYNIIKKKNARAESSTKDLDAESDAYVRLIKAQGQYSEVLRNINKQKASLLSDTKELISEDEKLVNGIIERLEKAKKTEIELLTEKYEEEKALLIQYGKDITELTAQYQEQVNNIMAKELVKNTKNNIKNIEAEFNDTKIKIDYEYDLKTHDLKEKVEGGLKGLFKDFGAFPDIFSTSDIDNQLQRVLDYNNEVLRITKEKNESIIAENQKLIDSLPEGEESNQARLEALANIANAEMEIRDAETQNILDNIDAQEQAEEQQAERRKERLQLYTNSLTSVASIIDMVAKHQHQQIEQEYKDGKISEETAKKRFEDTKKMQIASAVINMAAGVVSAIAQAQELGPIAGPIAAALNAAAVITAGVIQISNIKKTKFGSGDVPQNSVQTPDVSQITNEFTPQYIQNVTADSELTELSNAINSKPLFVSVTDIDNTQNMVRTRNIETSF